MRIFITGASGFIGIHLARRLNQTEHELNCLVRKTSRTDELSTLRASLIEGDVTDRTSVRQGMKGCDWVVNLANLYSLWEPEKRDYARVNIEGTRNVMECALDIGISKVVHVSTVAVYGKPADCPFTERSTVGPIRFSEYARTKYEGERIAWELHEKRGLPLVVVYPGAVVGPGDPKATGRYVRDIIHKRLPATVFPNSVLTFVHVRDVAEVIVRTLEKQ
ncbi:MAG: NAD-dependent epimerase/dehydratase family protein, partial [Calditrichaeota bacterium]|nr:NAD-dependent epimerase/dehydratase family protein [Calditrichota bacterium]